MDAIVEKALAKWPNVPHCYGWLALDARGNWRMRDEQAQQNNLPGERIHSSALIGFIQRNYTHDEQGRWYFQNGPQRVYVDLEVTPYVVRTDPRHGFTLHTDTPLQSLHGIWLSDQGRVLIESSVIALLDDRDMAECLLHLKIAEQTANEDYLLQWMAEEGKNTTLFFQHNAMTLPVRFIAESALETRFGFVKTPRLPAT